MFKKRGGVDILDIPEMHRRKLIELPEPQKSEAKITKDGFFDLSQNNSINTNQVTNFLSDFASIGVAQTPKANKEESDVKDLKWRIENLEFKLDQLIEKINSLKLI